MGWLKKRWGETLVAIIVLAVGGFVAWAEIIPAPMPEALAAAQSDTQVEVVAQNWLVFRPLDTEPRTGFIFYPGGRVDPRAYAPAMKQIAQQGYLVVVVPMPLNLAVLAPSSADAVITAFPEIQTWVMGGHSLGGSMAANYVHAHPQVIKGLVLWAAYPAGSDDLTGYMGQVASIYGTNDGLATVGKIDASRSLLPPATMWLAIEGGNHGQFGWYGEQAGDHPATITRESQQEQTISATVRLLAAAQSVSK